MVNRPEHLNDPCEWIGRRVLFGQDEMARWAGEHGTVLAVDMAGKAIVAWVRVDREGGPDYHTTLLHYLIDLETHEDGPIWSKRRV